MDSHRSALRYRLSRGPAEGQETGRDKALVGETERLVAARRQSTAVCGWARAPGALRRAKRKWMKGKKQPVGRHGSPSFFSRQVMKLLLWQLHQQPPVLTTQRRKLPALLRFYCFVFSGRLGATTSDPHQAVSTGAESKLGVDFADRCWVRWR